MVQFKSILFITLLCLTILLSGCIEEKNSTSVPTPTTPTTTATVTSTSSAIVPEAAFTGNGTQVKLDSRRGFIPDIQTIKAGDEVVWENFDTVTVSLVSNDGLFDAKSIAYYKRYRYIFKKLGTYTFTLENTGLNGTIIVESQGIPTPVPSIISPKESLSTGLYVTARMKKLIDWTWGNEIKYELDSLKVQIFNQQNNPLSIKAQILSGDHILEEQSFVLEKQGSSIQFSNGGNHFVNSTNLTLRLLTQGYPPIEYPFIVVDQLN
jgi:plastocyanin